MRSLAVALFVSLFASGCSAPANEYAVRNSIEWECGGNGGHSGVLYRRGIAIDTVDLTLGVHALPTGVIFAPVRTDSAMDALAATPIVLLLVHCTSGDCL